MVEIRSGIFNDHVQHLFAICQQISLSSGFRENDRLTARNPLKKSITGKYTDHAVFPSVLNTLCSKLETTCMDIIS